MKKTTSITLILVFVTVLLISCNLPFGGTQTPIDENLINTSVAQTLAANGTGLLPTIELTLAPTIPTVALPTIALPTIAPTEDTCNRASWVEDVSVPDGSVFLPNVAFTKTWRLKNVGSCTWNTSYAVVYFSGDQMSAPAATPLLGNVPPGGTVDVSVNMKSPGSNGDYRGNFKLRSDTGLIFGTGSSYTAEVFAQIEVSSLMLIPDLHFDGLLHILPLETLVYDFSANYCSASWHNASVVGDFACPGTKSDAQGFVVRNDNPRLQDNVVYTGTALFTHPQWVDGGSVSGTFPLITIENGMKFRATLGCGYNGAACDVRFLLRYRIEGGTLQQLEQWDVKYSDVPVAVDVDLSALAGKKVNFVLQVVTNGPPNQDWAHWVNPRIIK
jgi:hypothetical protein